MGLEFELSAARLRGFSDHVGPVLRIIATVLVFTATGGLVAGCGGDSGSSDGGSTDGASSSISKAQAKAYAHAINLRAADLPGMAVSGKEGEFHGLPFGSGIDRCDGSVGRTGEVIGVISPIFGHPVQQLGWRPGLTVMPSPTESMYSAVYVMRSEAFARQIAEAAGSARTRACLKARRAAQPTELAGEPYKSRVEFSSLPSLLPAVRLYGLRESGTLPAAFGGGRTRTPFYVDVIGLVSGSSDIVLRTMSRPRPVPVATERRLLTLLIGRAKTHQF